MRSSPLIPLNNPPNPCTLFSCGWGIGIGEQWQIQCATKVAPPKILYYHKIIFSCHCERAVRAWQSTSNESQKRIPTRLIASLTLAMTIARFSFVIP
ncbi:MAG: hypothetical protein K2N54_05405 [Helicobacter sp.]|nr:hypothetical protein [Helicobacter sp.]